MADDTAAAAYTPAAREALHAFGIEPEHLALVTVSENVTFKVTNAGSSPTCCDCIGPATTTSMS